MSVAWESPDGATSGPDVVTVVRCDVHPEGEAEAESVFRGRMRHTAARALAAVAYRWTTRDGEPAVDVCGPCSGAAEMADVPGHVMSPGRRGGHWEALGGLRLCRCHCGQCLTPQGECACQHGCECDQLGLAARWRA